VCADIGRGDARRFLRHRHVDFPEVETFVLGRTAHDLVSGLLDGPPHHYSTEEEVERFCAALVAC
jgi:selenocysteine lyase/cysteine desulfurase